MYVAVKGGERAIEASWRLLDKARRGDTQLAELSVAQIREQLRLAVARVMTEGSVYDEELAALAIKQAAGDLVEAIFLLRAYRTTLPRFGYTQAIDTEAMQVERRISATFKDVPGGQLLGATYDYTQRLLDFALLAEGDGGAEGEAEADAGADTAATPASIQAGQSAAEPMPRVVALLDKEGLIEQERPTPDAPEPGDLSREPLAFPASRATRLQNLARGDEGFLLAMGYATQRGYAHTHPFAGEIRFGTIAVEMELDELGEAVEIGDIDVTECQMINQFAGSGEVPPAFTQGYGLAFGHSERKAMAMALVDRALRAEELGETLASPTQDVEFMLSHSDNVEASGFVQHLKLPHYVDFQSELELVRRLRARHSTERLDQDNKDRQDKNHDQQEQAA
ncbi:carbon-phosphorus lyase complex subunit PhnI [Paraburkholderia caffeinilytica]|uniref:Carbon-phosphorus lyase complex subunit PhnI n=1 Tax=Paraburkholderia caffeinilytica TaxID=1761016 RepID=A0ABQ1NAH6_9BURK|nr:carbon-phosphorus lyase complex subunit PhnI [Paraburkholderia caffeinilytica]AXL49080.1 carbon-phosphorus lyase complex subunit PhnI [Paraburkholderia caffeinilytica]GGC56694.1 carbon-phosphorus lyase complex subunit PhnI [Paraburkholderia caffeinilytica]CAB3807183.1 Alpha-D-ribose 1-methylphosphonate 5-triphosphate synthase subunit PhnI [Paraburkholderia caffeinilytica]